MNVHPLRRLRAERGWSQLDLAHESGVLPETISMIETGKMLRPRRSTITCLAYAFDMTREEMRRELGL